jgi:hypothetical protein
MARWWSLAAATALAFVTSSISTADDKEKPRNPFNVVDVPDPDGEDVKDFAARTKLEGDARDANAEQWAEKPTPGKKDSLDGEWSSRWNGGSAGDNWVAGAATVKKVGDRIYILYKDRTGAYLIEAKMQGKSRLVGRFLAQRDDGEAGPWVGEIVNAERIDGAWNMGRWDLRRKLGDK